MAGNSQGDSTKKTLSPKSALDKSTSTSPKEKIDKLMALPSIDKDTAKELIDAGFSELADIHNTDLRELRKHTDIKGKKLKTIKKELSENEDKLDIGDEDIPENEEEELSDWLTGESDEELKGLVESADEGSNKRAVSEDGDTESLKAWLSGEKDSFTEWLEEESFEEEKEEMEKKLEEKEQNIREKEKELNEKEEELEELKEEFKKHIDAIEKEDFEPDRIIEENTNLNRILEEKEQRIEELTKMKEDLKDEIEEIKKGSVAVVKYLKSQEKKGPSTDIEEKMGSLKKENLKLKKELKKLKESGVSSTAGEAEKEAQELQAEIAKKNEDIERLKEQVRHKEKELNEREDDLRHREEIVRKERKKLESLKQEMENKTEQERKRELEELKKEIERKEQDLKAKEKYIEQKERELRAREEDLIDEELEEREEEILQEIEQEKSKTGTGRLDDLLMGGIPLGSNVSIYGPPHVGKEVMVNTFIAEGLEKGVPAIWVITDKTIDDIREEMKFVIPTYEEYEIRGLVYYVDAYSASMGEIKSNEKEKEHIKYIEDQSDVRAITEAVNEFADEINKKHRYYRMAFESVSTIIAYLDTETTFRILQPFTGKRKRDNAVALYTLEKGMHTDQDISMLGHIMNGEIKFKVDQLKNYLKVEGLGDVQTRDWIEYSHSKSGITMGSFSLDTIR